jgi:ubiquinol-cytochrome c reductase cytochrome b subunit
VGLYLFALPLIDKRPNASLRSRAALLALPALFALGLGALGAKAARHDAGDAEYQKARAKADVRMAIAREAATRGVPPTGAIDLPELRAHRIFEKSCASCHVLGELGDPKKANAPALDGWGTEAWLLAMLHDPDAPEKFGRTPYREVMPSADAPKAPTKPIATSKADMEAIAHFLATQGDEPTDPPRARSDASLASLKKGESIVTSQCTTCHLYKDDGDLEGSGTAPNLFRYGSIAWTRAQIANPTSKETYREAAVDEPTNKGHMPRFDSELAAADIDLVARWVRDRGRATTPAAR